MKIVGRHIHSRGDVFFITTLCFMTGAVLHYKEYIIDVLTISELFHCADDISCYGEKSSNNTQNSFPASSIFIISSSCSNKFSVYESCAIESITRSNNSNVYVLVTNPLKYNVSRDATRDYNYLIKGYQRFRNIIHKINIYDFVKGTPLEGIFVESFLSGKENRHKVVREVLKLAALYRFGGAVIDLEMLVAEPAKLELFGVNGAARKAFGTLGGGILALDRKTEVGEAIFNKTFQILNEMSFDEDLDIGVLVTQAYLALCCFNTKLKYCRDFNVVIKTQHFYPLNLTENHKYFKKGVLIPNAYGYYLWDRSEIMPKPNTLYWKLMKKHCPKVHGLMESKT